MVMSCTHMAFWWTIEIFNFTSQLNFEKWNTNMSVILRYCTGTGYWNSLTWKARGWFNVLYHWRMWACWSCIFIAVDALVTQGARAWSASIFAYILVSAPEEWNWLLCYTSAFGIINMDIRISEYNLITTYAVGPLLWTWVNLNPSMNK